jgi:hypothetical protein
MQATARWKRALPFSREPLRGRVGDNVGGADFRCPVQDQFLEEVLFREGHEPGG